ncbi:MAG TPA: carboxypeptidase-like regulatory domain-containing protein, partial [Blastocatellia bacterium]|nr:carboxypeptidase-like regulatory domain-containing protein [Blastocatellia bacterium]
MQWTTGPHPIRKLLPLLTIALSLVFLMSVQAQQIRSAVIRVTAFDESDKPVAGVLVEAKLKGSLVGTTTTNEKGEAEFTTLAPGTYEVVVSKETFEPLTQGEVALTAGASVEIKFTMIPRVQLKDVVVNVQAGSETPIEKGASPAAELRRAEIKNIPAKPATVKDTLPLV